MTSAQTVRRGPALSGDARLPYVCGSCGDFWVHAGSGYRGAPPMLCVPCRSTQGWCCYDKHSVLLGEMISSTMCRPCAVKKTSAFQAARQQELAEIKLASGCVDCGYRAHPDALDFDHLPGSDKEFNISRALRSKNWDAILAEVAKCEVRCANCHRVKTAERR